MGKTKLIRDIFIKLGTQNLQFYRTVFHKKYIEIGGFHIFIWRHILAAFFEYFRDVHNGS